MDVNAQDTNFFELVRVGGLATAVLVLIGTYLLVRFLTSALQEIGKRWVDKRLIINQIATLARFAVWLGGLGIALAFSVNLTKEVLLAIGGTAAVTIGFALKDLAASILAGVIIIIDRPFQVGDRVSFGGVYGEIASIGLRSVRLVTLDDDFVTIPNNKFLTDIVTAGSWGTLDMLVQVEFFIGMDQDVARAEELIGDALTSSRYAYPKRPWSVAISQGLRGNVMAIRLNAKAHVFDVQYERAFQADVTKRVLAAFREHDILPPAILHRDVGAPTARTPSAARDASASTPS